ncbi:unnamed protein product [Parnassius apollo]|uniref:(apollo) hypothetical protein n=1 Tax=Parnassius apollo TaxID=110799 RepID=A0A8S3W6Q3_PARAO|nr:unnamed protein product [Parnassius apollo]
MKTLKSPENVEVTPSKKKLKQARLPFKILSDVLPEKVSPNTRKRKLSTTESEPITKIGKVTKENDLVATSDELVVISDDDSKDTPQLQKEDVKLNPYVKLVDTAWKKKLQRTKSSKKKKSLQKETATSTNSKNIEDDTKEINKSACMDVDAVEEDNDPVSNDKPPATDVSPNNTNLKTPSSDNSVSNNETHNNLDSSIANLDNETCVNNKSNNSSPSKLSNVTQENLQETENIDGVMDSVSNENDKECDQENKAVTPKRSSRNKAKTEQENLDKSQSSICESPDATPQHNTRSSSVTKTQDVSLNDSASLTPKQAQKKLESAKKKEEREKEKLEREKKKQQEKEERAKQKQEKEDQKRREREEKEEAKRKEREEKEEQKRKEREEKERQKELEKKLREEKEDQKRKEREEKEEIRRKEKEAKEEEKRKKREAQEIERLEQEQKKKKAAEAFVNFFVPKQKNEKDQLTVGPVSKNCMLSSFTIKADMRLAPTTRNSINDEQKEALDNFLKEQNVPEKALYIKNLKEGDRKPMSDGKTWPCSDKENDDDVIIVEDDLPPIDDADEILNCETAVREKLRPKLLSFHENRRPPYWGTWRKKSAFVKPRRPFQQDQKLLDYEVDSDEEWEEEQEGESIDGSAAGSEDEQDADEYEVDNEVFVPHGYLSDEEATMDEDDVLSLSPETQKARLKHLEDEFESELKKPTEKLKPRMYGILWETADGNKPEKCVDALWDYFKKFSMIMNDITPLLQPSNEPEETEKKKLKKKKTMPDVEQAQHSAEKKKKDSKESKKLKPEAKTNIQETMKNQPVINTFLTKLKSP